MDLSFYNSKSVLVTGNTGFKGTWLTRILVNAGAKVVGYARCSPRNPDFFALAGVGKHVTQVKGDVRDYASVYEAFCQHQPEVVFHLAAQPLVRESYKDPQLTYDTNLMGTVNVLEAIRNTPSVRSAVIVTTDKVYRNNEWPWGYRENDVLDGYDPYSNSKSCAELAVHSYRSSFLDELGIPVSTMRAGNVLGGGDFAQDRVIPDCVRAAQRGEPVVVRNPHAVRPFQHVLEPLFAYLLVAERQYEELGLAGCYNVGPNERDCITAGELVELFCKHWGDGASWTHQGEIGAPHEAGFLRLDCGAIRSTFGWHPRWGIERCMELVCRLSKLIICGGDVPAEMDEEIRGYARS